MCTRYAVTDPKTFAELVASFLAELADELTGLPARPNAAPGQKLPVIRRRGGRAELAHLHFGLRQAPRPPATSTGLLVNARAETLLTKPTFRDAARFRRCLIPANGFYEWERLGAARQPHFFHRRDGGPLFLAGLWQPDNVEAPAAFAIVTTEANAVLRPIHDRMPVLLGPNSGPAWLGEEPLDPLQLDRLCRPQRDDLLTSHRVHPRLNNARYEAADCTAPWTPPPGFSPPAQAEFGLD